MTASHRLAMNPMPLVSVVIPAYDAAEYVEKTLRSVLEQTYGHLEVVVVDDGSTDGTRKILESFRDDRLKVVHQARAGACAARNRAFAHTRGDFVQFLDADDLLGAEKIERQVNLLRGGPAGCLAVCGTVYFQDGEDPERGISSPGSSELNSDDPLQWLLDLWTPGPGYGRTRWGMVPTHSWLVPRAVAEVAGPWDTRIAQDQDGEYFTRVVLTSSGIRWEPEGRSYYRKRSGSVSSGRSERHLRGRLLAVDSKARHVLPRTTPRNRTRAKRALARQYLDIAFHAYPENPPLVREAEEGAERLGGYESPRGYDRRFFDGGRLERLERVAGWKAAKRLSVLYRRLTAVGTGAGG